MNAVFGAWTPDALPADWTRVRYRWELGHAIHAALFGLGFSALVVALLVETPNEPIRAETQTSTAAKRQKKAG